MGKVRLEMIPPIARMLDANASGWLLIEEEIGVGSTVGDLLASLALSYPEFRKAVFDPDTGEISEQVNIILNNLLLPLSEVTRTGINDGDNLMFLPVYSGG